MMSERVQPGATIPKHLWQKFREDVKRRHGKVRGVLGDELETALRNHLDEQDRRVEASDIQRIDARLQRIESQLNTAQADGGDTLSAPAGHTHTDLTPPVEKPHPNAPTETKVRWLAAKVIDEYGVGGGEMASQIPESNLREVVTEHYSFQDDERYDKYVSELIDHFGYVSHPTADHLLVTPAEYDELTDQWGLNQ